MSSSSEILKRDDIIDKKVVAVYQSEWYQDPDGYAGAAMYILLDSNDAFETDGLWDSIEGDGGLPVVSKEDRDCWVLAEQYLQERSQGQSVLDFVKTEIGACGVLLSNREILFSGECDFICLGSHSAVAIGPAIAHADSNDYRIGSPECIKPYWPLPE